MSLSFVSKAIQTTAEDGTFEEKPVEGAENDKGGSAGTGVGLFEQLRQNQEHEDAEREEQQRAMMRGTLALDEDDAAHLQQLDEKRQQQLSQKEQQTNAQLASFRAAQADKFERRQNSKLRDDAATEQHQHAATVEPAVKQSVANASFARGIIIKKKRRRTTTAGDDLLLLMNNKKTSASRETKGDGDTTNAKMKPKQDGTALSNLLAGYSSSSDDE